MYPKRLLLTLGILAFVVGLVVWVPARFVVAALPGLAGQVSDVSGTVWAGQAVIRSVRGPLRVSWHSHSWRLLQLSLAFDWTLSAAGLSGAGSFVARPWGYVAQIDRGEVAHGWLALLLPESRMTLDKPLLLRQLRFQGALNSLPSEASGTLAWGPGTVQWVGQAEPLLVPFLRGLLGSVEGGRIRLVVEGEPEPGKPLLTATLDPAARVLEVTVLQRAATLAGVRTAVPRPADTVLMTMRQTLP